MHAGQGSVKHVLEAHTWQSQAQQARWAVTQLAPRLPAFLARYPEIKIDASVDDAFVDIVEQGLDAGIRIGEMIDREMIGVRVSDDLRIAVVASPEYLSRSWSAQASA